MTDRPSPNASPQFRRGRRRGATRWPRPADITLVAVSKMHPAEMVVAAYQAGLRVFGENRVEEAAPKATAVAAILNARRSSFVRRPSSSGT